MKFTVATGGCNVAGATLALTVGTSSSDGSNQGGALHTTVGTGWSEGSVTWANAPAANAGTIASLGAVSAGTTYTLNVASAVTGDGVVSFRLNSTSSDGARYFSKEGSSTQRPKLTITCAGGGGGDGIAPSVPGNLTAVAASATQVNLGWDASTDNVGVTGYAITRNGTALTTVGGTTTSFSDTTVNPNTTYTYSVHANDAAGNQSAESNSAIVTTPSGGGATFTFAPTDDAYVDQVASTTNFGAATRIVTDNSPVEDGLMKFTVATGGCTVSSATLSLTVGSATDDASGKGGDLHTTVGTGWSEGSVTWATAPAANAATIASLGAVSAGTTYTLNVTSAVTGDGVVSFRLNSTSSDGARYFSKEGSSTQRPKLTITCVMSQPPPLLVRQREMLHHPEAVPP